MVVTEAYVRELEERLRLACQPCAECGHVDWRELDDILNNAVVTRTFTGREAVISRNPGDELRMTQPELQASVAAFCDEDAERDHFEAQSALLDSPDIISGARPVDTCDECAASNVGPCPHITSSWPKGGLPHGEHPYDYGSGPSCTCWTDAANAMCPLHGMDAPIPRAANSQPSEQA